MLRRDDPDFWEYFISKYAMAMNETPYFDVPWIRKDGVFDALAYEEWIEDLRKEF